jgi:Mn2+/Fe2+ NRAMP family transporter
VDGSGRGASYCSRANVKAIGALISISGLNPIKALYWSAVINAVISVPIMTVVMVASSRSKIMHDMVLPTRWVVLGWLATGAMAAATLAMFATMLL